MKKSLPFSVRSLSAAILLTLILASSLPLGAVTYTVFPNSQWILFANNLDQGNCLGNTFNDVLPAASGVTVGSRLWKFDNVNQNMLPVSTYTGAGGWMPNAVLAPGEGAYLYSTAPAVTVSGNTPSASCCSVPNPPPACRTLFYGSCGIGGGTYSMLFGPSPVPALTRAFKHQGNAWIEYYYDPDVGDWVPGEPVVATGEAMWVVPPCPGVFYPPSHVPPSVVAVGPDLFVDLQASYPSPLGTPCCGQDMTYTIVYGNLNSAALHNAKIILNLDSVLATYPTPSSSPPTYTAPGVNWVGRGGNTLNWKIPLLAGYASGTLTIKVKVAGCVAPTVVGVASSVTFEKNPPTFATANHFAQTTCSFDPNDKTVNPRGCGPEGLIPADTDLSYVVQFQNLGTGPANQVVIRDTLDPHLDLGSFQMIAGSHPFSLMVSGRELAWTFAGINLPAASADEAGSHGYVKFTVKQNPGLPVGTLITNRAMIYFDLNPPVLTRTTTNTITANAVPLAAFNVSQRTPLVGANVNFTYTGGTPGASFAWDFGSGAVPATSTAQNPTGVSYSTAGPKLPVLKVTLGGCEAEPALNLINVGSLLPPLGIARNGTNAILSWDDEAYQLQATPSFGSSVTWTNVPEASPVAVPITGSLFFRLIKL